MISSLQDFNPNFFKQEFLDELRKESLSRSLPSKAVLDALRHSTSLNKQYQAQITTLSTQLDSVTRQNLFLKSLISKLSKQIEQLKFEIKQKNKKISSFQTYYETQIQSLTNQNILLRDYLHSLRIDIPVQFINHHNALLANGDQSPMGKTLTHPIEQTHIQKNHLIETRFQDQIPFQDSLNFRKYLNYDEGTKKANEQTQPSSKLKLIQQPQISTQQKKNTDEQYDDQFMNMLISKQESQESQYFKEFLLQLSPQKSLISSIQQFTPNNLQKEYNNQLEVDNNCRVSPLKLQSKRSFDQISQKWNPSGSKCKIIHDNIKFSIIEQSQRSKTSDITFFNVNTKKNMQARIGETSLIRFKSKHVSKEQMTQQNNEISMEKSSLHNEQSKYLNLKQLNINEFINHNEIESQQNEFLNQKYNYSQNKGQQKNSSRSQELFYNTHRLRKSQKHSNNNLGPNKQLSAIDLYHKGRIISIINQLKQPSQQSSDTSNKNNLPSILTNGSSQQNRTNYQQQFTSKNQQRIKTVFETPYQYMPISQSLKTIDSRKSYKQLKQNFEKSGETINKIKQIEKCNEPYILSRTGTFQKSGQIQRKSSKLILFTSNKRIKTLDLLSFDSEEQKDDQMRNKVREKDKSVSSLLQQQIPKDQLNEPISTHQVFPAVFQKSQLTKRRPPYFSIKPFHFDVEM